MLPSSRLQLLDNYKFVVLVASRRHPRPEQEETHYKLMNVLLHEIEELEREVRPSNGPAAIKFPSTFQHTAA